jgi:hypothetical protein
MLPELKNSKGESMADKVGQSAGGISASDLQKKCKKSGGCKGA